MTSEQPEKIRINLPPKPTAAPTTEIPSPGVQNVKVMPKKETVRINLPPMPIRGEMIQTPIRAPFTEPCINKIPPPVPFPEQPAPNVHSLVRDYVALNESTLRHDYGVNYIAFVYVPPRPRAILMPIASHENRATLQRLVEERYIPAHPEARILVTTIDHILYPDAFNKEGSA